MPNLLVTGGAGFIGASFVHHWMRQHADDRVVVLDALTYAGNVENLRDVAADPRFSFVRGNICDQPLIEELLRRQAIDVIVNFAAESHVDRSIEGPDVFVETNVVGTHALLKAARTVWMEEPRTAIPHRFHHVSTDEVYGSLGPDDPPFHEGSPYAPNSPYAASKAASDFLVRAYQATYGLSTSISNCTNNYGPLHFPEKLIPLMIVNALEGRPLPVYGDGRNIRDWLFVEDHCRAIERVLLAGRAGETYNIGGGDERTNLSVVRLLCRVMDEEWQRQPGLAARFPRAPGAAGSSAEELIAFVADRPGHDFRYAVDSRKIERELQFRPRVAFQDGLRSTIRWYLEHAHWWRSILDGSYRAAGDLEAGVAGRVSAIGPMR